MSKPASPLAAFLFSFLFLAWLAQNHYTCAKNNSKRSLNESPDNPQGAGAFDFYRLRDPKTGLLPYNFRKRELTFAAGLPQTNAALRSIEWQNRGPYNLGGRTRALALDVTNENIILAGQVTGGMWRSDDAGASFTQTTQPGQLHSTTCIAQDKRPGHTNTWYYGTGEQYAIVNGDGFSSQFAGDGIFKSTDGGHTWAQLSSTVVPDSIPSPLYQQANFDFVWQIVTDSTQANQDVVYAATVNGIWRSIDGGTTWAPTLGLDSTYPAVSIYSDVAITSGGVLYATISSETPSGGIYRSPDGINWTKITPAAFPLGFARIEIGIAPSDQSQLYIIAQTPGVSASDGPAKHNLWHYHYLSGDGSGSGGAWTNCTNNVPDDHCEKYYGIDFKAYNSQDSYDMFIAVHPSDTNLVFLGGTDLYRSTVGFSTYGYSWIGGYQCDTANLANYTYPNHHSDQHRLLFLPSNPSIAYSATDGGVFKTENILADTVVWQDMNNGYNTGQFYTCAIEPGNATSQVIIGGLQDNGSYFTGTSDYTQPWYHVLNGDGAYCAITHNRTNYYMSFEEGKVFKMSVSDNGTVNNLSRIDPSSANSNYIFIAPFILNPADDNIMYLADVNTIWRNDSLNSIPLTGNLNNPISQGWVSMTNIPYSHLATAPNVSSLCISDTNPDLLYFGTDQGHVYKIDSCRTSTTASWTDITGSNFPVGGYVSCVAADRLNASNVMVTFSNYHVISIFYSSDGGQSWADVSGNLEQYPDGSGDGPSVTWANIYNNGNSTKYYAATSIGLFSTDSLNGLSTVWSQEGASTIGNEVVDMVISRTFDSTIVVATHGNGIYSNHIFIPSAVQNIAQPAPELNCFPNPFTHAISISIKTTATVPVEVEIFDINGKLVRKLSLQNGVQTVWDGTDFSNASCPAGTYFIKATQNGKSVVKKVVRI